MKSEVKHVQVLLDALVDGLMGPLRRDHISRKKMQENCKDVELPQHRFREPMGTCKWFFKDWKRAVTTTWYGSHILCKAGQKNHGGLSPRF